MKLPPVQRRHLTEPLYVAFTPKGGCPLKLCALGGLICSRAISVAFTPKGGAR